MKELVTKIYNILRLSRRDMILLLAGLVVGFAIAYYSFNIIVKKVIMLKGFVYDGVIYSVVIRP